MTRTLLIILLAFGLPFLLVLLLIARAAADVDQPVRVTTVETVVPDGLFEQLFPPPATTTTTVRRARVVPIPRARTAPSLERIKQCESGGRYDAVSKTGKYRGAYQADDQTWNGYGGYAHADDAPPEVQDQWARELHARRGNAPWPTCGRAA